MVSEYEVIHDQGFYQQRLLHRVIQHPAENISDKWGHVGRSLTKIIEQHLGMWEKGKFSHLWKDTSCFHNSNSLNYEESQKKGKRKKSNNPKNICMLWQIYTYRAATLPQSGKYSCVLWPLVVRVLPKWIQQLSHMIGTSSQG